MTMTNIKPGGWPYNMSTAKRHIFILPSVNVLVTLVLGKVSCVNMNVSPICNCVVFVSCAFGKICANFKLMCD